MSINSKKQEYYDFKILANSIPNYKENTEPSNNFLEKIGYEKLINGKYNLTGVKFNISYKNDLKSYNGLLLTLPSDNSFVIYKEDNNFKIKKSNNYDISLRYTINIRDNNLISSICLLKIKDYKESSRLFRYNNIKKDLFISNSKEESYNNSINKGLSEEEAIKIGDLARNKYYKIQEIFPNYLCKLDGKVRDCISILDEETNKELKFVYDDLEFIIPDIEKMLKGYNISKDKTIKVNKEFKVINNNRIRNIKVGSKGKIVEIMNIRSKRNHNYLKTIINNKECILIKKNIKIL